MICWIPFFDFKLLDNALMISAVNVPESSMTFRQILTILNTRENFESVASVCDRSSSLKTLIDVVFKTTDEGVLNELHKFFERLLPLRSFSQGDSTVAVSQFKSVLKPKEVEVKKIQLPQTPKQDSIMALLITRFPQYRRAFYKSIKKVDTGNLPKLSAAAYANIVALGVRFGASLEDKEVELAKKVAGVAIQHAIDIENEEVSIEHAFALFRSSTDAQCLVSQLKWIPRSSARSCKLLSQTADSLSSFEESQSFIKKAFTDNLDKLVKVVDMQEQVVDSTALECLANVASKIKLSDDDIESFLITASQRGLSQAPVMRFARSLLNIVQLPPHLVLSLLQYVYGSDLFKDVSSKIDITKQRVVEYIHTLFYKTPAALCQLAQINPLVNIYNATLHPSDALILDIFNLYERVCRQSLIAITRVWTPPSAITPANTNSRAIDAAIALDSNKIFNTCLSFPNRLSFSRDLSNIDDIERPEDLYDPRFLMALLSSVFMDETLTDFEYLELFRYSLVNIPIMGLSSRRPDVRKVSLHLIGHIGGLLNVSATM